MSVSTIRTALAALISDIPNIGRVHVYERYAPQNAQLVELYVAEIGGEKQLRGWYIRRVKTVEERQAKHAWMDTHTWMVRGFMALSDADQSELAFEGLIEAVRDALRGFVAGSPPPAQELGEEQGPQVVQSGPVMFAGKLCHAVTITLRTREFAST